MPPQQQSASHRTRRIHRTVCWGWSPTDFTDLHRWLGCEDSSGGILASAAAKCLPQISLCWGCSPTDFTDRHRWLGCVDSPTEFTEFTDLLISGGALVSARLCRLPEQEVHQPSKQWSSHRFHRSTQKLLILGWCTSCSVGALLTRLVHLRQVHPLEGSLTSVSICEICGRTSSARSSVSICAICGRIYAV